jgi:hypothetical protein
MLTSSKICKTCPAYLFFVFLVTISFSCNSQQLVLSTNGVANYIIATAGDAKEEEAARILKDNLDKITGANFEINHPVLPRAIHISTAANVPKYLPLQVKIPGEEGVTIKTSGDHVLIIGGAGNGMNNAVYEFLEKYLGCRYYSADAVLIPQNKNISVPANIDYTYTPAIKYRYIYFNPAFQGKYAAWNKLHNTQEGKVSVPPFGLWVHSMFTLVPPDTYFATHPEYYALRNGKRTKTQLDLTNPDVLNIATRSLAAIIQKNPQAIFFSVSQMDNNGYCQCDNCRKKAAETGSQSGVIVDFVNKLAAAFPDKTISTLAYNYSRNAPSNIKPAKNVNIMFCASKANHSISFANDKLRNSVYSDLKAWGKITDNIFFWDYVADFRHLYLPFPIYHTLQPNIQFLASNKVTATFQQGWAYRGSDMSELKTYLLAQLLWNPDADIEKVKSEFVKYYYGPAAPYILQYLDALTSYVQSNKINLTTNDAPLDHVNDFLSPAQIKIYGQYFNDANKAAATNPVYSERVQNAEQSLRYAVLNGISKSDKDSRNIRDYEAMLNQFKDVAATAKVDRVEDGNATLNDFVIDQLAYQKRKIVSNLAENATATITDPDSYEAKNMNILFDNITGNKTIDNKWVAFQQPAIDLLVDFKKQITIDSVSATFMHNPQFKVQLPAYIKYSISNDGKKFTEIGTSKNLWAGLGAKEELKTFTLTPASPLAARYLKLNLVMVNSPNITGDDLPQSMLCDEILVR